MNPRDNLVPKSLRRGYDFLYSRLPVIRDLDVQILKCIRNGGRLDMSRWHSKECSSTHCVAGWAVVIGGAGARHMELLLNTEIAALALYYKAGIPMTFDDFYKGNQTALHQLKERAALQHNAKERRLPVPQSVPLEELVEA